MLVDLHLHTTRYSTNCSQLDPRKMVKRLMKLGLDGGVITDHDHTWSRVEIDRLQKDCGAEDLYLVSGMEVESEIGHLLVFGYDGPVNRSAKASEIIGLVRDRGGVVIWAHPFRWGLWDDVSDEAIVRIVRTMDGIEALTPNHSREQNERAMTLARENGLTATGSSDAHTAKMIGAFLTRFEYQLKDLDDLIKAIKEGACTPVNGKER